MSSCTETKGSSSAATLRAILQASGIVCATAILVPRLENTLAIATACVASPLALEYVSFCRGRLPSTLWIPLR